MKNTNQEIKFTWKIGGEAGFGIKAAGQVFAKAMVRAGYEAFDYSEYPSLIRGGHNTYQITVAGADARSAARSVDLLVALNQETIDLHLAELSHGAGIIYDGDEIKLTADKFKSKGVALIPVPLKKLASETGGEIMRNTVAIGASLAVIGLEPKILENILKETFAHKPGVIEANIKAIEAGFGFIKKNHPKLNFKIKLDVRKHEPRMLIAGNEAMGLGALAGGLNFFSAYPMTPATSVLHYLAGKAVSEGLIVKHAEDEISVINMALGASHAGARAMCATSGGGFALMGEAVGLAGISETPLVIINVQRPGPATGMPTWTDQGDLRFVLHAAQGEFPRIVLAPGDVSECFYQTAEALNLAEKYQLPVIILSDKFLGEGDATVPLFDENKVRIERGKLLMAEKELKDFRRYEVTADGISPRTLPGTKGGMFSADSYEHDAFGFSSETAEDRVAQVDKRAKKLHHAAAELGGANHYGPAHAKITLVSWGSTKGPILDALELLPPRLRGKVNFLHLNVIWPFPAKLVKASLAPVGLLGKSKKMILIENNSTAQLGALIRQETGIEIKEKILKYDGRPFFPEELAEKIAKIV
jgi:2-oxoglutarate ferredoxin oxidoreductase subunit alpha